MLDERVEEGEQVATDAPDRGNDPPSRCLKKGRP
jgi:hypothetical protein